MNRIRVTPPRPPAAPYDVVVSPGALARLPALVRDAAPAHRYAVIADRTVADRFGDPVLSALREADVRADLFVFPAGEANKTRATWVQLTDRMLERGIGRDGCVIALGGGVTGDLAGFVAATYMRGIPLVQVPTSLLAMVDASVGGKTGVDTPAGKNLVGAFHQPRTVVVDPEVLRSLPETHLRAGLAEAVKHGAITDPGYLEEIERDADRFRERDPAALARLVRRSVEIKASFVSADPREAGARKALNFGHTIGHAVESATDYALLHGFAVAIGMVAEAALGEAAGVTEPGTARRLRRAIERVGLPTSWEDPLDADALLDRMRQDKKARAGRVRYTLLARTGEVARSPAGEWSLPVDPSVVRSVIDRENQ